MQHKDETDEALLYRTNRKFYRTYVSFPLDFTATNLMISLISKSK